MRSDVAVVILAGGEGRRIGGAKPLRNFRGERLIDRALLSARRWSKFVAIAVRDPTQVGRVEAPIIIDDPNIAGPLSGLVSALMFAASSGREFLLTIPVDMPFLPADLLDRLLSAIGDCGCAIACSGGHDHPVSGLWRISALDRLGQYLASEKTSLKGFAALLGCRQVDWPTEPLDPFFNINTADELRQALERAKD